MKRVKLLLVLVMAVFLAATGVVPAFAADMLAAPDCPRWYLSDGDFYWAKDDLKLAVSAELLRGYPGGEVTGVIRYVGPVKVKINGPLKPDGKITRAEYAALLTRALDISGEGAASPFSDVKASDWFGQSVLRLVRDGIIRQEDYGGKFGPNEPITRVEIAAWVARAAQKIGFAVQPAEVSFSDFDAGSKYADEVRKAVGLGILKGYPDGTFRPSGTANRAEAVVMLIRLLKQLPLFPGLDAQEAMRIVNAMAEATYRLQERVPPDLKNKDYKEPNPELDAALKAFQQEARDLVTDYNLESRDNPLSRKYPQLFKRLAAQERWPAITWGGFEGGSGLLQAVMSRAPEWAWTPIRSGYARAVEVLRIDGRGPIAEVKMKIWVATKYLDGNVLGGENHIGVVHFLFVKQDGKWRIAAVWAPKEDKLPTTWLAEIGYASGR